MKKYVRKTYVEFLYPGLAIHDSFTSKVKNRDLSNIKVPEDSFGFRFFDVLSTMVKVDGKKVQLKSERINLSPMHYYGGKVYTLEEIKCKLPEERILIQNVEGNGYTKAIRSRTGNWQLFDDSAIFIETA